MLNEKSGDPKKFWDCIKSIFPNKSAKTTLSLLSRDDAKVRANSFSNYFKNVIRTLKTKAFPLVDFAWRFIKPPPAKTDKRFIFKCVSRVKIERDLRSLQRTKATGIDELLSAMLKDCAKYISSPLCYIINLIVNQKLHGT